MKKLVTLAVTLSLAFMTVISAFAMADPSVPTQETASDYSISKGVLQQTNMSDPQPINLYFAGGDGGELRPEMPAGNQTTDVPCPGSPLPRAFGLLVGIWTTPEISAPLLVEASISVSIWAKSDQGASNVRFNAQILVNGNQQTDIYTNSQSLSGTPSEFIGDGSASNGAIELNPGDTIGARVYYFADSQVIIGPAPDSTMIVGGADYDTHITIKTAPIFLGILDPVIDEQFGVVVSAIFIDAFSSTSYISNIRIDGITNAETLSQPLIAPGGNGTFISWIWDWKTDGASNGDYTITITLSYSEDNEFGASGQFYLEFPKSGGDDGGLLGGGWLMPVIIIGVVAAVAGVAAKIILGRRSLEPSKKTGS
jgi:hypothetical protein